MSKRFADRPRMTSNASKITALLSIVLAGCSNSPNRVREAEPQDWATVHEPTASNPTAPAGPASADPPPTPPLPFVEGSSTLVVLPDTQVYAERYPSLFEAQTRWIAEHVRDRNIVFVLHLGDVTEHNAVEEWRVARGAFSVLEGVVPYGIAVGNHDCGEHGFGDRRRSLLSDFFPVQRFATTSSFEGTFESGVLDNSVHSFSAGGMDWMALFLEWAPRDAAVEWGNRMLRAHPDRVAIVVTHAYLYSDDTRYEQGRKDQQWGPHEYAAGRLAGGVNDGEQLWNGLVRHHANVAMVLSGHVLGDGAGLLSSSGDHGNTVHQLLSNYQMMDRGGEGYLRLIEVLPDGKSLQVKTYSPVLDAYMTTPAQQFTLSLDVSLSPVALPVPVGSPVAGGPRDIDSPAG